ncbi:VOC family protein [Lachnoclostridium phytofermentans]|uniref:Glyoxalase/bleomycin resistance protein/dioxygenase n=1 Tax=Lachnoclostridium phytofermentans (strain ATCC 700394 / DSM 18823 / ISDg) TaxID=357809 RepID=A9KRG1_LACP7|nr:VOC family protein [Lachnoclostridium phytofermentans]ABX42035.1 Glyoxalase/bleomycin resistance protein/dioxygenase [Lachnoclostridium phytofermentans ISDg]
MFKRIDHVAFSVKDRQKSIDFYEKYFGFKKYFEHDVPGVPNLEKVVYLQLGDTVLEFEHWSNEKENRGYHFCLISGDFDSDYQKLKNAGIPVVTEPHIPEPRLLHETGWKRVVFQGPDGELIEFRG